MVAALGCGTKKETSGDRTVQTFPGAPVVLISIDTLRSDHLPVYGYADVETPVIDAIRGESILFERVYSPAPMTLPAHVSMLTGTLPATHGVRNNVGYTFQGEKTFYLPCYFRSNGYATGAAVSTYVLRRESGMGHCFDFYEDSIDPRVAEERIATQQRSGWTTLAKATDWIAPRADSPFFLMFHIYEPHAPYDPPEPYRSRYARAYDGEIASADAIVGRFVGALREMGVWERAIVIVTSDHGEGFGDHGEEQHSVLLNRELIQVPLLIKLPRGARGGETIRVGVQLTDLAPTLVELSGGSSTAKFDGAPLLDGPLAPDRPLFSETLYPRIHLGWSDLASLVKGRFHYIDGPRPELYDVVADPAERDNLVETERRTASEMRKAIEPFRVPIEPIDLVDAETTKKIAALGYIGSPANRSGPLPDPKEHITELEKIRNAIGLGRSGHVREAVSILRGLLAANPSMVEAWAKLGEILTNAGDYEGAASVFREATRISPIAQPDLLIDAGHAAFRAERLDEAESLAHAAMPAVPWRAWDLIARVEMARGRFSDAEQAARRAQREPPQAADLVLLATTVQKQGRFDDTLGMLDEAERVAAAAESGPVYGLAALRADTLARQGAFERARGAYQSEIEHFPTNLRAWSGLSALYFVDGDREGVNRVLDEMVERNPGPGAMVVAARTLDRMDDPRGAARWRARASAAMTN